KEQSAFVSLSVFLSHEKFQRSSEPLSGSFIHIISPGGNQTAIFNDLCIRDETKQRTLYFKQHPRNYRNTRPGIYPSTARAKNRASHTAYSPDSRFLRAAAIGQ